MEYKKDCETSLKDDEQKYKKALMRILDVGSQWDETQYTEPVDRLVRVLRIAGEALKDG